MTYPLVRDLADEHIPVSVTCRVLGSSKQAFYAWMKQPYSDRDWNDAHLLNRIIDIHHDDPAFGYRFIADELARHGIVVSENRVAHCADPNGFGRCWRTRTDTTVSLDYPSMMTSYNAASRRPVPTSCG